VEKIGSNRRLLARAASFDFKRPYDLLLKFKNFRAPEKSLVLPSFSENAGNPVWRCLLNEARTYFEQKIVNEQ